MSDNEFRPRSSDPAKQHFTDAALAEYARLGRKGDHAFLNNMDQALDDIDSDSEASQPNIVSMTRTDRTKVFWLSGTVAAALAVGFFAVTFKPEEPIQKVELAQVPTPDMTTHSLDGVSPKKPGETLAQLGDRKKKASESRLAEDEMSFAYADRDMNKPANDLSRMRKSDSELFKQNGYLKDLVDVERKDNFSGSRGQSLRRESSIPSAEGKAGEKPPPVPAASLLAMEKSSKAFPVGPLSTSPSGAAGPGRYDKKSPGADYRNAGPKAAISGGDDQPGEITESANPTLLGSGKRMSRDVLEPGSIAVGNNGLLAAAKNEVSKQVNRNSQPPTLNKTLAAKEATQSGQQSARRYLEEAAKPVDTVNRPKPVAPSSGERYDQLVDNPFHSPLEAPLSTFSVDVDTASYSNIRRMVNNHNTIPADSVRIEEMINYFSYNYPQPEEKHPFAFDVETAECPWQADHQLMRVGIQGKSMDRDKRPAANLVFLLDVSGSMSASNKLPLAIKSMSLMIEELTEKDTISVVVYAGAEGLCLPPTSGDQKKKILDSLNRLKSGGSTNGGAGIQLAYKLAKENFKKDGINRVILCTDGDFNVGRTDQGGLVKMVEKKAKDGTFLSVLAFGSGNINDSMMEAITNKGNGNYFYIDSLKEGRKVLLQDLMSTLVTIAKDVKIQIEFNPKHVQHYRLIGYANRMLKDEDFENDKVDAGEIGAGHSVTALYEIVPAGAPPIQRKMTDLKYQEQVAPAPRMKLIESDELCTVKLRYKLPRSDKSTPMELPVNYRSREWEEASDDYQFSAAVALWGMLLRNGEYCGAGTAEDILEMAKEGRGEDPFGRRDEFLNLVKKWEEMNQ